MEHSFNTAQFMIGAGIVLGFLIAFLIYRRCGKIEGPIKLTDILIYITAWLFILIPCEIIIYGLILMIRAFN